VQIPAVLMRGGTSRGLFFHEEHLPADPVQRDAFLLAAMGSPDPYRRQIDGLGGAVSTTSKIAIIGDGGPHGVDVTYEFGQVSIDQPLVDRRSNCGNILSAVGPYAVDEGLVEATDPITFVRILNLNTQKVVVAHVPTRDGRFDPLGSYELAGVPRPASKLQLDFMFPGGAVTGSLLPTGRARDEIDVPGIGGISVSLVDAANPLVFVRAQDLGLSGFELPGEMDADPEILSRIEAVRARAAVLAGIASDASAATQTSPSVPKLAMVMPPTDYIATSGEEIAESTVSLKATMMSMGRVHNTYPLTGAIATTVASRIAGTLVHEVAKDVDGGFVIGHPAGRLPMTADVRQAEGEWKVEKASGFRSSRRLMEGRVLVPDEWLSTLGGAAQGGVSAVH
jgi:2-methylaconitate cis-trans-isomerase PrpF